MWTERSHQGHTSSLGYFQSSCAFAGWLESDTRTYYCAKAFFEATKSLSGEKYSTASVAIVLTRGLIDVMKKLKKLPFSEPVEEVVKELGQWGDRKFWEFPSFTCTVESR